MFMKKPLLFIVFLASAAVFAQKPIFASAKVKAATVYFNSVELSQNVSVNLPAGSSEIVIKNVANYINEETIRIGAPTSVTILSAQFSDDYISEYEIDENNPKMKIVKDSIIWVQKELLKVNNSRTAESKTIELLDKNNQVAGINSGLNVAELIKLVDYYKQQRTVTSNSINSLDEKITKLNTALSRLKKKLEINTEKEEKTSDGKLILQVMNETAGIVPLEISYISNEASWKPFYDLRAESVAMPINMMYKAQVTQNTGIDWKKIKLTLSSGNPNQNNQAPMVNPWFLRYQDTQLLVEPVASRPSTLNEVVVVGYGTRKKKDVTGAIPSISNYTIINENQLNISFDIDIPYDILSNGKAHSVALKEIKLPATYKYYAAPKIEKEAFLLAEIVDYGKYNLLKGEANIIFEGMYVGKTMINPNQVSDTLNLSMGRDKKISIKREKVADKSGTKFLSSKKEQTFTYDITLRNNKKEAVEMLLKDQYPLSPDKEIEIELLQSDNAKADSETGILTWNLNLKPNETKKIRISYSVKYPKDKVIDNL
jgi:uncharacterized protein (TIGR02231 family)